jgi:Protein of unknown function (DUF4238)
MSSLTRNNHFVPVWYQQGFLSHGEGELFVLDKTPDYSIHLPDGTIKKVKRRPVSRRGPYKFLRHTDLYTTQYFGALNDEIERNLFGNIDDRGAKAIALFKDWPTTEQFDFDKSIDRSHGNPNDHLVALLEYLDAQKVRTPKGLALLKSIATKSGFIASQNTLMILMQQWRLFLCTMLAEGFLEIVSASHSDHKFVYSDDPVTLYNCDHYPNSQMCQFPNDPHIFERGTRVIFPLDSDHCLIISHIEHANEPKRGRARQRRRNARAYDQTILSYLDVHRTRELNSRQVATINYVIKKRAVRYIAAGSADHLFPESIVGDPRWSEIDTTLHYDGFARKLASGETIFKYTDESVEFHNEFGERQLVPGWFVRRNKKPISKQ